MRAKDGFCATHVTLKSLKAAMAEPTLVLVNWHGFSFLKRVLRQPEVYCTFRLPATAKRGATNRATP